MTSLFTYFLRYLVVCTPSVHTYFFVFVDSSPLIDVQRATIERKYNFYFYKMEKIEILGVLSDVHQIFVENFKNRQIRSDIKRTPKTAKYLI